MFVIFGQDLCLISGFLEYAQHLGHGRIRLLQVNATSDSDQRAPQVAVAEDGRFVVVWHGKNDTNAEDIYAQTYDACVSDWPGENARRGNLAG